MPDPLVPFDLARREVDAALERFALEASWPETVSAATQEQIEQLLTYLRVLCLWRQRLSLVSTADPEEILRTHIVDSLVLAGWIGDGDQVGDLGSGAGFPGIPLAIIRPRASVTLIEARQKRASFLREVARSAGLPSVTVLAARAESLAETHRGRFDLIVARAVGSVQQTLGLARPLLRPGGMFAAMKGERTVRDELGAPPPDGFQVFSYTLPGAGTRMLVIHMGPPAGLK